MGLRTVILLLALSFSRGLLAQGLPPITDLGLSGLPVRVSADWFLLQVEESQSGGDLNGDGDTNDLVWTVYDLRSGKVTNVGLAADDWLQAGNWLVLAISERDQDVDLNGDGDDRDTVVHLHDLSAGTTTNLKVDADEWLLSENHLVLRVSERAQGVDLNGDGDDRDSVVSVRELSSGTDTNLGLDADEWSLSGDQLLLAVSERAHGKDFNDDGDDRDEVLHVHDLSSGRTTNLKADADEWSLSGNSLVFQTSERTEDKDLNGDGDTRDTVWQVLDLSSGEITNVGLAGKESSLSGNWLILWVSESDHEEDLNGDGDVDDDVWHVYDLALKKATNLRLAAGENWSHSGNLLVLWVFEVAQGEDLNGDGTVAEVGVAHVHDLSAGKTTNLRLVGRSAGLSGDSFVVQVPERTNREDLNGDGDTKDWVWHVYDLSSGETTNLGVAGDAQRVSENWLVMWVSEEKQGGRDLNGDGDANDSIWHVYDFALRKITNLRLASGSAELAGRWLVLAVAEHKQGADLNGDGDTRDLVIRVLNLATEETIDVGLASNEWSFLSGSGIAVWAAEDRQGADLNGDGDQEDLVAYVVNFSTGKTINLGRAVVSRRTGPEAGTSFFSGRWLVFLVSEVGEGKDLNGDGDTEDFIWHATDVRRIEGRPSFLRGDCNADGQTSGSVADAVFLLRYIFTRGQEPPCLAACDPDADASVTLTDAIYLLRFNFAEGSAPVAPFPACGETERDSDFDVGCRTPRVCP